MKDWYKDLNKAPWTPPNYIFKIIWGLLYYLMIISFIIVWKHNDCFPYCNALNYFLIQLFFNLIWTTLFFKYKMIKVALLDILLILILTLVTYNKFIKYNLLASYLLIPYIIWLFYAFSLNLYIYLKK